MIIRKLEKKDAVAHEKLAALAFILKTEPDNASLPCDFMLGAFEDGVLIADAEIEMRQNYFCGSTVTCAAVGGVASRPEYRNRGAVRAIFEKLFSESCADISILYPFSASYYKKFGYEPVGKYLEITVPFSEFSDIPKNGNAEFFEGNNPDELLEIYNRYAVHNELSFVRNDVRNFEAEPYKSAAYTCIWRSDNGEKKAFATFSPDRNGSVVSISEIGFADIEALKGIIGFLRAYEGNFDTVRFEKLPLNTPVTELVRDVCRCEMKCGYCGAVRVLNVENILKKHSYPVIPGEFTVGFTDSIERNNGIFTVRYENGHSEIIRNDSKNPNLILDANAFSRVLLSGISENEIEYTGGISVLKNCDGFLRAFPKKDVFFSDPF